MNGSIVSPICRMLLREGVDKTSGRMTCCSGFRIIDRLQFSCDCFDLRCEIQGVHEGLTNKHVLNISFEILEFASKRKECNVTTSMAGSGPADLGTTANHIRERR